MSVLDLRHSRLCRNTVLGVLTLFLLFGGAFLPLAVTRPMGPRVVSDILHGPAAAGYIERLMQRSGAARAAISVARTKPGSSRTSQIVVTTKSVRARTTNSTLVSALLDRFRALADEVVYYGDDGVLVLTPFEADSNDDTAEFNIFYEDYETGYTSGGDGKILSEAAATDPYNDSAVEVTGEFWACKGTEGLGDFGELWATRVLAQNWYGGAPCSDNSAQLGNVMGNLKQALKTGLIALGSALIPCIGSNIGYLLCVGSAFVGAVAVHYGYETADYFWSCRCYFFSFDCDDDIPPI